MPWAMDAAMPGMLTAEQMEALRQANGAEFDRLFLKGMIQHHNGALTMVKDLFDTAGAGQDADIFDFATDADNGQRAEIRIMESMLEKKSSGERRMTRARNFVLQVMAVAAMILIFGASQASGRRRLRARSPRRLLSAGAGGAGSDEDDDPFAVEAAPALPPGMTGSDANDPRAKLTPGFY